MCDAYTRLGTLDDRWLRLVDKSGLRAVRDRSCFVSYDGAGTLLIAPADDLDADDTVAALVLHELCHRAVRGDAGATQPDWGLVYEAPEHIADEHAALRLQRWLAGSVGLADVLHPTTVHRGYYEVLADIGTSEPTNDQRFADTETNVLRLAERGRAWLTAQAWWPDLRAVLHDSAAVCAANTAWKVREGAGQVRAHAGHHDR